ncbi:MAG TPA: alpha/beta hydrolase [Pseudonocardiaceae bacterium]
MTSTWAPASALSPHAAERTWLPSGHGPLAALVARPAAEPAATVLLVPGYTGSKEDFAPLLDPIAAARLTAVAVDLPGQYESPGPDDEREYLPERLGAAVTDVVAHLGPAPVVLLGHSYGGLVSRAAVLAGAEIAGLVLLCSGPAALPAEGRRRAALDAGEPVLRRQGVAALQTLRDALEAGGPARPPALVEFLRARFLASAEAGLLGMATGLRTEPDRVDELRAALAARAVPAFVACGAGDDAWPVATQRDMAERLGVPFALVEGAAHSPNVENPAALLDVLLPRLAGWLSSTTRSTG